MPGTIHITIKIWKVLNNHFIFKGAMVYLILVQIDDILEKHHMLNLYTAYHYV